MTNTEIGEVIRDCNARKAALLAVHLVNQVLDEAYVIANTAKESGQSWQQLSILKSFKTRLTDTDNEEHPCTGTRDLNDNSTDVVNENVVVTSTPQKITARFESTGVDEGEPSNPPSDGVYIGQGDGYLESDNELAKSTSMFINHLFDMSDVERIVVCNDPDVTQDAPEPNDFLAETMNKILESFPLVPNVKRIDESIAAELSRSDKSDYSFLADAFVADISRDVAFYIDDDNLREKLEDGEGDAPALVEEIITSNYGFMPIDSIGENISKMNDVALYENAYASLNRDYDQGSEEDGYPILQDPKEIAFHEVKLMTANTSDEDLSYPEIKQNEIPKEIIPTGSGISGSRKSTLARRCRIQGARLLACLRGWWRRKTPGRRKENRFPILDMCPLSPDARRRSSSLVDNRLLRSPSPSRPVIWKFNTVNEVMVSSNRWKEYTFDTNPTESVEN